MKYRLLLVLVLVLSLCELTLLPSGSQIVYAQTWQSFLDSLSFTRYSGNPVMTCQGWENNALSYPVMLEESDHLSLYYTGQGTSGGAIGTATTSKGSMPVSWTRSPSNPIFSGSGSGWDSREVAMGSILKVGSDYYLYYFGYGGNRQVGLATSTNGITFTRYGGSGLVLGFAGDEISVECPAVVRVDPTHWYMYYSYRTSSQTLPGIRVATSQDGKSWTRAGQVLSLGSGWDSAMIEWHQAYYIDGHYVIMYEATGTPSKYSIGMAYSTSPTGMFTKYSGNPVFQGAGSGFDSVHVATPTLYYSGSVWYLMYQGGTAGSYPYGPWNFGIAYSGSAPPNPTGTLRVFASYNGSYVSTSVVVTGPQNVEGTTTIDPNKPLNFSLVVGTYTVSGTYFIEKSGIGTVVKDQVVDVPLNFGGSSPPPVPELPFQLIFIVSAVATVGGLVFFARRQKSGLHFSSRRQKKKAWGLFK